MNSDFSSSVSSSFLMAIRMGGGDGDGGGNDAGGTVSLLSFSLSSSLEENKGSESSSSSSPSSLLSSLGSLGCMVCEWKLVTVAKDVEEGGGGRGETKH